MSILKKDKNAHFTHNLGVGIIRTVLVFFILFTALLVYQVGIKEPQPLEFIETKSMICEVIRKKHNTGEGYYYTYDAQFIGMSKGDAFVQRITKSMYYDWLPSSGRFSEYSIYMSPSNTRFAIKSGENASELYRKAYPSSDILYTFCASNWLIVYIIMFVFFSSGLAEIRVARRYRPSYIDENGVIDVEKKMEFEIQKQKKKEIEDQFDRVVNNYKGSDSAKVASLKKERKIEPKIMDYSQIAENARSTQDLLQELDAVVNSDSEKYKYKIHKDL